jgi:outer membrane protein TolC
VIWNPWRKIRELQAEEAILERNIALQQKSLELVQLLHRQGVVSDSEEQQARAQVAGTRALLPQIRQARLVNANLLAVLLGRYPSELELRPFDAEAQARGIGAYALPAGVPSDLLARRPDVIIAEQSLAAATASEGVAIANRFPFPMIGFGALFGRSSTELGSLFDSGASAAINSWGPQVGLPILNVGRDLGNVRAARAQTTQALIGYRRAVQAALFDVNAASYAYRAADEQLAPLTEQYAALLNTEGLGIQFVAEGIKRIAEIAYQVNEKTENIGARRLHTLLERLLEEVSFSAGDLAGQQNGTPIVIDAAYVNSHLGELAQDEDLSRYIL